MGDQKTLNLVKRLKLLADTGLVYATNDFERERHEEIRSISMQLMSELSGQKFERLEDFFMPADDYPTPKVDTRAFILNEQNEVLLVKEQIDGKWSLPGGWADIGYTPQEVIIKELQEETGMNCSVIRLLAVYDKKCHPHPPQPFYVYKMVFHCKIETGDIDPNYEIEDAGYFKIEELPELSQDRILKSQIQHLYRKVIDDEQSVYCD